MGEELTNDLAMVMGMAGDGYAPEDLGHAFFQQLLGGSANVSLLREYEDFKAACEAPSSECAHSTFQTRKYNNLRHALRPWRHAGHVRLQEAVTGAWGILPHQPTFEGRGHAAARVSAV